jgi:hypothetical protein
MIAESCREEYRTMPRKPPDFCEENGNLYGLGMEAWLEQELTGAEEDHLHGCLSLDDLESIRRSIAQALAELRTILSQSEWDRNSASGIRRQYATEVKFEGNKEVLCERTER